MLVKLLGLLDILTGVMVGLLTFGIKSPLLIVLGGYLIVKGVIFFSGASLLDLFFSLVIFYAYLNPVPGIVTGLIAVWLLQKGIFSLAT